MAAAGSWSSFLAEVRRSLWMNNRNASMYCTLIPPMPLMVQVECVFTNKCVKTIQNKVRTDHRLVFACGVCLCAIVQRYARNAARVYRSVLFQGNGSFIKCQNKNNKINWFLCFERFTYGRRSRNGFDLLNWSGTFSHKFGYTKRRTRTQLRWWLTENRYF